MDEFSEFSRSSTTWTIENLSCWNVEVHGEVIENPHSSHPDSTKMLLYPKGLSGKDKLMVLRVTPAYSEILAFYLMVLNSNGKVVYTESMGKHEVQGSFWFKQETHEVKIKPLEEVVTRSWETVSSERDRIIVCCVVFTPNIGYMVHTMRTMVEVFDVNLKIPDKIMKECAFPAYTSTIEYPREDDSMCSMNVYLSSNCNLKMCIELEPECFEKNILVYTYLSVVTADRAIQKKGQKRHLFKDGKKWIFRSSIAEKDLKRTGAALVIRVKIIPSYKYQHTTPMLGMQNRGATVHVFPTTCHNRQASGISEKNLVSLNHPRNSMDVLTQDFTRLYRDHDFSDFQLRCGDVTFPVHKNILSARSPIFKSMLSIDMRETSTGAMDITDIDASTIDLFLSYLYAGIANDLQWESALKLYYAADKYQVLDLKADCSSVLGAGLCIENVCDLLSWAEKHQDASLSTVAENFIVCNYRETLSSEKWKSFMVSDPLLAVKTLTSFAERSFVKGDIPPVLQKD